MGANGKTKKIENIGKLRGTFCDKFGSKVIDITLDKVHYVPNQAINLFSLTKAMQNGWTVHGNDDGISISKGDLKINFDRKIQTAKGFLRAVSNDGARNYLLLSLAVVGDCAKCQFLSPPFPPF
jgi:hypothetical protein